MKKAKTKIKVEKKVDDVAVIAPIEKPVILTDITFESIHRQEHFRIGNDKFRFRNYKLTILKCTEGLKNKLLAKSTIKLSK